MPKEKPMAEKIISEIRFIETDDGFRIEFKGDKERWREMGFDPGAWRRGHDKHGHHGHGRHHHKHGRHSHGHHRHGWRGHGCAPGAGPWAWWGQWDEDPEAPAQKA
jgi:hypothetical protein